jgi:N-methylhydantoinase B/oxoprolinase/acetone carboxylase alpha subunit
MSGDIELLEHAYPILIHRYSLMADSGGAGEFAAVRAPAWRSNRWTTP